MVNLLHKYAALLKDPAQALNEQGKHFPSWCSVWEVSQGGSGAGACLDCRYERAPVVCECDGFQPVSPALTFFHLLLGSWVRGAQNYVTVVE
jgi:hypothetical protein